MWRRVALSICLLAGAFTSGACTESEEVDPRVKTILELEPDRDEGGIVFDANCTAGGCHGPTGDDGVAPSLSDRVPGLSDEELLILWLDGTSRMPAQSQLDDQEKADVLAYVTEVFD